MPNETENNKDGPGECSPRCSRCGSINSVDVCFAACVATSKFRKAAWPQDSFFDVKDDIRLWRIPLCAGCAPSAYQSYLKKKMGEEFGCMGAALFWVLVASIFARPVRLYAAIALVVYLVALAIAFRKMKGATRIGIVPPEKLQNSFLDEGRRIIASGKASVGEFSLPQHQTRDKATIDRMRAPLNTPIDIGLPGAPTPHSKNRDIVAVGATVWEVEDRLPNDWKSLWAERKTAQPELRLADKAECNSKGLQPLHASAITGNMDMAKSLLASKVDVNGKDNDGWTPLHWAARKGRENLAELLLVNKAEVNATENILGYAPLHGAVAQGHKGVAELLLRNKANVNAADNGGRTPLALALFFGHKDIAELMRQHGGHE